MRYRPLYVIVACALTTAPAAAQVIVLDGIYTGGNRDKPAYRPFTVTGESPRGLTLKEVKSEISAEEIDDAVFLIEPQAAHVGPYRRALNAEREARAAAKDADRAKALAEALARYEEALTAMAPGQEYARAHLEYKIADIRYQQARDSGQAAALQEAVAALESFHKKRPRAWQTSRALRMLAQAQADLGRHADAEKTYHDLASSGVADAVRHDAEVQALMMAMRGGRHAEAQAKLQALAGSLPRGSASQYRARLALAECLGATKDLKKATEIVKEVLKETKDRRVRGAAYNVLGYCHWLNGQWQDARWEFLRVDVVYNEDKEEHAKALYYLADIFARLGEGEQARQCAELLRADPQLAATDYARRPPPKQ